MQSSHTTRWFLWSPPDVQCCKIDQTDVGISILASCKYKVAAMPLKDATLRILSLTPFLSRQRWRRRRSPCPSAWRRTWPTWTQRSTEKSRPWTSGWTVRWWGWTPAWGRSLPGWQRIFFSSANFHLIYQVDNIFFICSFSFFCQVDSKDGEEGVLPQRKTGQAGAFQRTFR